MHHTTMNKPAIPHEILARFVERFKTVPASPSARDYVFSAEQVAETLIWWIQRNQPEDNEKYLWDRVMQDRLYFEMGEVYLAPYRAKYKNLTNRRYAMVGRQFTQDMLNWVRENV